MRVLQYNIWQSKNVREVLGFLKQENPDVVTLQEVRRGGRKSPFDQLQQGLGYHGCFGAALVLGRFKELLMLDPLSRGPFLHGNAILSRYPITSSERHFLPGQSLFKHNVTDSRFESRSCVMVELKVGDRQVVVGTTHLTYELGVNEGEVFSTSPLQLEQARRIAELLRLSRGLPTSRRRPIIFTGDLNNTPGSEPVRIIRGAMGLGEMTPQERRPTFPVHLWERKGLKVEPDPHVQIDYVFAEEEFRIQDYRTVPVDHSDHLPIIVELALDNEEEG